MSVPCRRPMSSAVPSATGIPIQSEWPSPPAAGDESLGDQHAGQADDRPNRQVDPAGDDHEPDAEGVDPEHRDLARRVDRVRVTEEVRSWTARGPRTCRRARRTCQAHASCDGPPSARPVISAATRSCVSRSRGTMPMIRPSCITTTRSHSPITSSSSELTVRMVMPRSASADDLPVDLGLRGDVDAARRLVENQDARRSARATSPARPSADCRPRGRSPSGARVGVFVPRRAAWVSAIRRSAARSSMPHRA